MSCTPPPTHADASEPYELQNEVGSAGPRTLGICVTSTDATRANEDLVLKMVMLENIFCTWPPRCDQIDRCSYSGHKSEKSNRTTFLALPTPNNNQSTIWFLLRRRRVGLCRANSSPPRSGCGCSGAYIFYRWIGAGRCVRGRTIPPCR